MHNLPIQLPIKVETLLLRKVNLKPCYSGGKGVLEIDYI